MATSIHSVVVRQETDSHPLSAEQVFEIMRAREATLSRLLMAFIASGLKFMLFLGTLLGVWNLLQISGRGRGAHFAGVVAGAWPRSSLRLDLKFFFWDWLLFRPEAAGQSDQDLARGLGVLGDLDNLPHEL